LLASAREVGFIHADPPWLYERDMGNASPELIYQGLSMEEIVSHLDAAYDCTKKKGARLAVWYTWPKAASWRAAGMAGPRWGEETTGGAWVKTNRVGVGYHWRGQSEPVALFTKGTTGRPHECIINAHCSDPTEHSEKPLAWLREWVRAWTLPGEVVLDLYAGKAPLARACLLEGRRYLGAEIDPERHEDAMRKLHKVHSRMKEGTWGA
jgi:site-specific DNA-methyltransferase (adenine-specific)